MSIRDPKSARLRITRFLIHTERRAFMAISRKTGLCAFIVLVIGFLAVQGGPRVSFAQDGHLRESVFQLSGTSDINNGFAKILVLLQFTVPSGRGRAVI